MKSKKPQAQKGPTLKSLQLRDDIVHGVYRYEDFRKFEYLCTMKWKRDTFRFVWKHHRLYVNGVRKRGRVENLHYVRSWRKTPTHKSGGAFFQELVIDKIPTMMICIDYNKNREIRLNVDPIIHYSTIWPKYGGVLGGEAVTIYFESPTPAPIAPWGNKLPFGILDKVPCVTMQIIPKLESGTAQANQGVPFLKANFQMTVWTHPNSPGMVFAGVGIERTNLVVGQVDFEYRESEEVLLEDKFEQIPTGGETEKDDLLDEGFFGDAFGGLDLGSGGEMKTSFDEFVGVSPDGQFELSKDGDVNKFVLDNMNRRNRCGHDIVVFAIAYDLIDVVRAAVDNGYAVERVDNFGNSYLHWSNYYKRSTITEYLTTKTNIDVHQKNVWGYVYSQWNETSDLVNKIDDKGLTREVVTELMRKTSMVVVPKIEETHLRKISVRVNQKVVTINNLEYSDTVLDLKKKIHMQSGVRKENQSIRYHGNELSDTETVRNLPVLTYLDVVVEDVGKDPLLAPLLPTRTGIRSTGINIGTGDNEGVNFREDFTGKLPLFFRSSLVLLLILVNVFGLVASLTSVTVLWDHIQLISTIVNSASIGLMIISLVLWVFGRSVWFCSRSSSAFKKRKDISCLFSNELVFVLAVFAIQLVFGVVCFVMVWIPAKKLDDLTKSTVLSVSHALVIGLVCMSWLISLFVMMCVPKNRNEEDIIIL